MKFKTLFIMTVLLIATLHNAAAGSMQSELAGSWKSECGALATYTKIKGNMFSAIESLGIGAYGQFAEMGVEMGTTFTDFSALHGVIEVIDEKSATFTYYGQAFTANFSISFVVTGDKTLIDDDTIENTWRMLKEVKLIGLDGSPFPYELGNSLEGETSQTKIHNE